MICSHEMLEVVVIPGLRNFFLVQVVRLMPRALVRGRVKAMQERVH